MKAMQFAERWIGFGSLVIACAATAFVARPEIASHRTRTAIPAHVDFDHTNCSGVATHA